MLRAVGCRSVVSAQHLAIISTQAPCSFQAVRTVHSTKLEVHSNRAKAGLFEGKDTRFGNNVSFSKRRTRRCWKPNARWKRLYSESLDDMVKVHVTTATLRTMDKKGGFDNYILGIKQEELGTKKLRDLRKAIAKAVEAQATGTGSSLEL